MVHPTDFFSFRGGPKDRTGDPRKILRDSTGPNRSQFEHPDDFLASPQLQRPQTIPTPPPPPPPKKSRHVALPSHVLRYQPPFIVVGLRRRPAGFRCVRRRRVPPAPAARGEAGTRGVAGGRSGAPR